MSKPARALAALLLLCSFTAGLANGEDATASGMAPAFGLSYADDLKTVRAPLPDDYGQGHPRLLFGPGDVAALKQKAEAHPDIWKYVLAHARACVKRTVPDAEEIRSGAHYWRIEYIESAALAYLVTGEQRYLDAARNWMVAYCAQDTWGTGWRENRDLQAAWYLYHIGLAYDMLYNHLAEADRAAIRKGLAEHAEFIAAEYLAESPKGRVTYGQNHLYIPATGMVAASLAIVDDVPKARRWIDLGYVLMRRSRYALGDDGYYYEGTGYWSYALHWHVRYAELMARATGCEMMNEPTIAESWRFALHTSLPGPPGAFDFGDTGYWGGGKRSNYDKGMRHAAYLWAVARDLGSREAQTVGKMYGPELDYPAASFLWFDPELEPAPLGSIRPHHHFEDHDVVFWRSGWDEDATCLAFRCGPPAGHAATEKFAEMEDWGLNAGHTHPDIGAVWLYGARTYLAGDTGYTARKFTRDHNTLLVGGKGQAVDGDYHSSNRWPYELFDRCRMEAVELTDAYAYARGEFSAAYPAELGLERLSRTVIATQRYVLVVDEMAAKEPQTLEWFCHGDDAFTASDGRPGVYVMRKDDGRALAVCVLQSAAAEVEAAMEPTIVFAGTGPGRGKDQQRGHHLKLTLPAAARHTLTTLWVPLGSGEAPPALMRSGGPKGAAHVRIRWPGGTTEEVTWSPRWRQDADGKPVTIETGRQR